MLFPAWTSIYHNFLGTQKRRAYATQAGSCRRQIGACTQTGASGLCFLHSASSASLPSSPTLAFSPRRGFFNTAHPSSYFTGSGEGSAPWKCKAPQFWRAPGTMKICFSQIVLSTPPSCFHPPYKDPSLIPDSPLAAAWATGTAPCSSSLPKCPYPGEPSAVSLQVLPQLHQEPHF